HRRDASDRRPDDGRRTGSAARGAAHRAPAGRFGPGAWPAARRPTRRRHRRPRRVPHPARHRSHLQRRQRDDAPVRTADHGQRRGGRRGGRAGGRGARGGGVMTVRSFLDVTDHTPDEIRLILDLAERPVDSLGRPLAGQGAALIFEKPSNRTRHSMEMAVVQLGGHPVYTRGEEVGFDTREPVEDIAAIMSGYHGLIAARVFSHGVVERLAAAATVPVVNMLSDWSHPLQAFADALTMQEYLGDLAGKTVAYVGDYNNVARSLGEIAALLGMHVRYACP